MNIDKTIFQVGELYYSLLNGNNVVVIPHSTYKGITHLDIPSKFILNGMEYRVIEIGRNAFAGCHFDSVEIVGGITTIDELAFNGCSGKFSLTLPNSITTIKEGAFHCCIGMEFIVLSPNIKIISGNCLRECRFKRMYIPEGVTIIGGGAFDSCYNMEIITFPSTLEYIGSQAFTNCSIRSIISYATKPPEMGLDDPFQYKQKDSFLFVPEQSVSLYQHDPGWRWYQFNVRPITDEVEKLLKVK